MITIVSDVEEPAAKPGKHKPAKQRPETAQRRDDILEAAMEVFGAKGFHAGTLSDVAVKVGMTHAGVLFHFGSKENLLREVVEYRDRVDTHVAHNAFGAEFFRHLIATAYANEGRPGIVQTYAVLSAEAVTDDNPGHKYFTERFSGLREMVLGELRKLPPKDDPVPESELSSAASAIIAVMDGLQVQWLLDPEAVPLADATKAAIEAIVEAVAAGGSRQRLL